MDIEMGGVDGITATRQILSALPDARVIHVTGHSDVPFGLRFPFGTAIRSAVSSTPQNEKGKMNRKATLSSLAAILATTLLLTVLTPSVAQAQPKSFSENFNSNLLPATLEESGSSPTYAGGVVTFGDARGYLRTKANYNNTSFTAEVTLTVFSDAGGEGIGFIGFGAGEPNCGSFFCEPMFAPSIYARIAPDDFHSGFVGLTNGSEENIGQTGGGGTGTHRVRITWNHVTKGLTFAIHRFYTGGPFVPTTTIGPVVVTDVFGETNSRIFFGGAGNVTFDDLVVFTGLAGTPGENNCHGKSVSALALAFGDIENAASALGFPSVHALQDSIKGFCRID